MSRIDVAWPVLAREAEAARDDAYAPYSRYRVGAALLACDASGTRVRVAGANIENASYGLAICAERVAVVKAITSHATTLLAIAIATEGPEPGSPCGMCRQVLAEFARDLPIALVVGGRVRTKLTLAELLPRAFRGAALLGRESKRKR